MHPRLRIIIYLLLIVALLWPTLWRLGILVDFKLRQDFIARTQCENRARPELNCKGNCKLGQRMRALQKQEEQQAPPAMHFKFDLLFAAPRFFLYQPINRPLFASLWACRGADAYSFLFSNSPFHPPRFLSID